MDLNQEFIEYKRPSSHIIGHIIGYSSITMSLLFIQYSIYIIFSAILIGFFISGSEHSLKYILLGIDKPRIKINGFVSQGYEKVLQEFKNNFIQGMEIGAQYCVYHKNELVVNLWGNFDTKNYPNYNQDSLQNVYSSTKAVTSVVVALLVDRGLLNYSEKVCKYWPEFSKNGKQDITLEQILRHEGGLPTTKPMVQLEYLQKKELKNNAVGKILENMTPVWNKKTRRTYHAVSRGYILNEIVRRVDPQQRTVGEILKQDITDILQAEFYIGVPENRERNVQHFVSTLDSRKLWVFLHGLIPFEFMGRKLLFPGIVSIGIKIFFKLLSYGKKIINFNTIETARVEIPSANGNGSALGMAKIAGIMANKGTFQNKQFLSKEICELAMSEPKMEKDSGIIFQRSNFVKGGWNIYDEKSQYGTIYDKYGFYGWQGLGGSLLNWHPQIQLGIAYAQNLLDGDLSNQRALKLRKVTYECQQQILKNQ